MKNVKTVDAMVGATEGGIGINLTWYFIVGRGNWDFLEAMLQAAGFKNPRAVRFERNKQVNGDWKVDWNQLRISRQQCEMAGILPQRACVGIVDWMVGKDPAKRFGIEFRIAAPVF